MKSEYAPELKAQVMAALLTGQAVAFIAREYKIPEGTIKTWKQRAKREVSGDATQKKELGSLLFDYVSEALITLKAQAEFFRDPKWLARQDAEQAGILHGIVADKAVRILEAIPPSVEISE